MVMCEEKETVRQDKHIRTHKQGTSIIIMDPEDRKREKRFLREGGIIAAGGTLMS